MVKFARVTKQRLLKYEEQICGGCDYDFLECNSRLIYNTFCEYGKEKLTKILKVEEPKKCKE